MPLEKLPTKNELETMVGKDLYQLWVALCERIDSRYEMNHEWYEGGKKWQLEYKFRRGGKTLCSMCFKPQSVGVMIIFGKAERAVFEAERDTYAKEIQNLYDESTTFHDGKWMMFILQDQKQFDDFERLLKVKRKPNRK